VKRAFLPWLIPLAMIVGVVVAATGFAWLIAILIIPAGWLLFVELAAMKDSGTQPRWMNWDNRRER
jgi:hypothetical protein